MMIRLQKSVHRLEEEKFVAASWKTMDTDKRDWLQSLTKNVQVNRVNLSTKKWTIIYRN